MGATPVIRSIMQTLGWCLMSGISLDALFEKGIYARRRDDHVICSWLWLLCFFLGHLLNALQLDARPALRMLL